jgi:uncharacterized membrane protein YeaQ/YmgE (transglycosylase-associated protein family)
MNWIYVIALGIVAGFIASRIKGNGGQGCIIDLIIGVVGSAVGGWIFELLGINTSGYGCLGQLIVAVIGAVVVLWLFSKITGKK